MRQLLISRMVAGNKSAGSSGLADRRKKRDRVVEAVQMVERNGSISPEDTLSCLRSFKARARDCEDWPKSKR